MEEIPEITALTSLRANRFLILGGYGNSGRLIAQMLLQETDTHLLIGGRTPERAEQIADELNHQFAGNRVAARWVDAAEYTSLRSAFRSVNFVVVASSSSKYVENISTAALDAGIDYLDTQYSTAKVRYLLDNKIRIEKEGHCFITDGGFHPGLPAALIRYAASQFDELHAANVGSVINMHWAKYDIGNSTYKEMIREFNDYRYDVYKDNEWQRSWKNIKSFEFGSEAGKQRCYPMYLEELRTLPEQIPSLKETGFYIAGFNGVVDYVVIPLIWIMMKISPKWSVGPMANFLRWGLKWPSSGTDGCILSLVASGIRDREEAQLQIQVSHQDGYVLTAAPVVACLDQYLNENIRKPGVHFQGHLVKPDTFLDKLKKMGIQITITWNTTALVIFLTQLFDL